MRIPAWKECFALVKRELEAIMEKEILPATMPEFPIVRRMTLGMNSPLVVPSIMARMTTEEMQKYFTDGWDPLFIGYTAAVYFHTSEAKVNSWTTQAKKMRGSQPPGYEVRNVLRALEQEGLENMLPIWDDGRMIMMEGHVALVDDMKFATRKYSGTLWLRTGGNETGGKRTRCSRSTARSPDGIQEIGPYDTITTVSRHAWRQEEWTR